MPSIGRFQGPHQLGGVLPVPLRLLILMQPVEHLAEPEDGLDIVRLLGEDFLAALPRLHELIQLRIDRYCKRQ